MPELGVTPGIRPYARHQIVLHDRVTRVRVILSIEEVCVTVWECTVRRENCDLS